MFRTRALRNRLAALLAVPLLTVGAPWLPATADEVVPAGTWPLVPQPEVVATFDPPESPWGAGHRGVDLLGGLGQPVRAALPGRVSFAALLAGRGVVVVDHGPTRTTYEPVLPSVRVGDRVSAGQVLGRLGTSASHCLPRLCLHWGWRRGKTYLDPLALVGGGPVRLLPLWASASLREAADTATRAQPRSPYAAWRPAASRPVPGGFLP